MRAHELFSESSGKKLEPKFKKKWVKALGSGDYIKTEGVMCKLGKKHDSFCCLGVAVDITTGFDSFKESDAGDGLYGFSGGQWSTPRCVASDSWGLSQTDQLVLINANDSGATFKQIAKWIRKNL